MFHCFENLKLDRKVAVLDLETTGTNYQTGCIVQFAVLIDIYQIFCEMQPRTLSGALEFFCGMKHEKAHQADEDVDATALVLDGQLGRYADLPKNIEALHERFRHARPDGQVPPRGRELHFTFGKHSGRPLSEVAANDPDYLRWMITTAIFWRTFARS